MKKIIVVLIILLIIPLSVNAEKVTFKSCVDGDTARVILNNEEIKIRLLAIDTPETKHPKKKEEPFGKEASDYTCNLLKNAKSITIEYDKNSDKLDKYDRHLVWLFVDDELIQEKIIEKGYAKVAYLYGEYKYTNQLEIAEKQAKKAKFGIWGDYEEPVIPWYYYVIGLTLLLISLLSPRTIKKIKKIIKKMD